MPCYARYLFIAMIAILGIGNMLTGCGSKGELYLPTPETTENESGNTQAESK